ncbi:uncharacterized protein LOC113273194 [Papaver somniferum]|uniref:uncharacterized protein LOC113273194 n=1 Tax=Papaver somniferum TaxID=3469 RepID=UPI000E6F64D6|nr:uncharacterized protein LOC113273194 [Papaver somniferum]
MVSEIESSKGKLVEYDTQKKNPVYHLGSSDGPGTIITPIVLRGNNYDEWSRAIRRSLIAKRKFGFIDGTIKRPEDPDQLEEWITVQSTLVSWIGNTLELSVRSTLGDYEDASLLWAHLKRRFCVVSGTRICQLKASLSDCKQKKTEGVAIYFGKLNKIWMRCSLREKLLAREPLPSVDVAYQTIVNSERLKIGDGVVPTEMQENVMDFKVQNDQLLLNSAYDPTKYCKTCSRQGHYDDGCFKIIGVGTSSADGTGLVGVTAAQVQQVMEILNSRKSGSHLQGKKNEISWIVDTGSTNHVTYELLNMISVRDIRACSVGLPDGKYAYSEKIGTVILPGGLKLENVLYVPQITFMAVHEDAYELWHQRMGHPSEKVLQKLQGVSRLIKKNNDACDICPRAKHRRSSFASSLSKSNCTPQQNGRVERKHQHIMNVARALRFQARLPKRFWGECALTAAYLINCTPTPILNNKTPYEVLFGKPPLYKQLKVFGCLCYVHDQSSKGDKFASRGRRCVFLGYPYGKKAWQVYDLDTRKFMVSRDVKFYETQFPYKTELNGNIVETDIMGSTRSHIVTDFAGTSTETDRDGKEWSDDEDYMVVGSEKAAEIQRQTDGNVAVQTAVPDDDVVVQTAAPAEDVAVQTTAPAEDIAVQHQTAASENQAVVNNDRQATDAAVDNNGLGKGKRQKIPSSRLKGFSEPRNFREAMKHPGWRKAMAEEIRALEEQGTWDLTELPPGKKALGSKWIYTEKYDENGTLVRLKARFVIFGNHQVEGLDYNETFAPVAKMTTVRMFLAVAAAKQWDVKMQLNVLVYVDDLIIAEFPMETNHRLALATGDLLNNVEKMNFGHLPFYNRDLTDEDILRQPQRVPVRNLYKFAFGAETRLEQALELIDKLSLEELIEVITFARMRRNMISSGREVHAEMQEMWELMAEVQAAPDGGDAGAPVDGGDAPHTDGGDAGVAAPADGGDAGVGAPSVYVFMFKL